MSTRNLLKNQYTMLSTMPLKNSTIKTNKINLECIVMLRITIAAAVIVANKAGEVLLSNTVLKIIKAGLFLLYRYVPPDRVWFSRCSTNKHRANKQTNTEQTNTNKHRASKFLQYNITI